MANPEIPPVVAPDEISTSVDREVEDAFKTHERVQRHNQRRLGGYGALLFAFAMYIAAIGLILLIVGLVPSCIHIDEHSSKLLLVALISLFTVPTILIIAVLRGASKSEDLPKTVPEFVLKLTDRLIGKQ